MKSLKRLLRHVNYIWLSSIFLISMENVKCKTISDFSYCIGLHSTSLPLMHFVA